MKRNQRLRCRTAALLLLAILAAACSRDDDFAPAGNPDPGGGTAAPLTIAVTDGAYASADAGTPATRTVERGYATEFTKGDRIGLYKVETNEKGETVRYWDNFPATFNGTEWEFLPEDADKMLTYEPPQGGEVHYFAYYPYQHQENLNPNYSALNSTSEFFKMLILRWKVDDAQSTYEAYTASDLMVAKGEITPRTDGKAGSVLHFPMQHQMQLVVLQVPTVKCTYTETIDGAPVTKSYRLYTGISCSAGLKENSYTMRFLKNPQSERYYVGNYYNSALEKRRFGFNIFLGFNSHGTYTLYTIDGGGETVIERPLREGDLYMKDGSILPQENVFAGMPAEVKADCLGVVFWVGEKEGLHWTQTNIKKGDHLLMRNQPTCTHGMAVALKDASTGAQWATGEGAKEKLYNWANVFSDFTPEEQADWLEVRNSASQHGYRCSRMMKLYGAYHSGTTFPALDAITGYAAANPAPGNSSGWFFPGDYELATLCFGVPKNFRDVYRNLEMLRKINPLIEKAGGNKLEGNYWSSSDAINHSWWVDLSTPDYGSKLKSESLKVRAVLAF